MSILRSFNNPMVLSTKDLWLTFGGCASAKLEGYCDANWASQPHHHSISGYLFHFGLGAISWSSRKQNIITLSSTEAEYVAKTHAAKEGIWLKTFVKGMNSKAIGPLTIMGNNQGAIALAKDDKFYARTKHINLRYHFIREVVEEGKVKMEYILTKDNVTNIFTKALPKPKFKQFVGMLGLAIMKEGVLKDRQWSLGRLKLNNRCLIGKHHMVSMSAHISTNCVSLEGECWAYIQAELVCLSLLSVLFHSICSL